MPESAQDKRRAHCSIGPPQETSRRCNFVHYHERGRVKVAVSIYPFFKLLPMGCL